MAQPPEAPRGPGRPVRDRTGPEVRARLIRAGALRMAARGYAGTSVREIADAADVTPAMISYYFGDKAGLLDAILASVFDRLLARIRELAEPPSPDGSFVERFVPLYLEVVSQEPWIPQLLVREVISGETAARDHFVERFASVAASLIPSTIAAEVAAGRLRSDLDPKLATLSLVGMCVFPFIVHPVIGDALGYELDPNFGRRLAGHTVRLFLEGAAEVPAARSDPAPAGR